MPPKRSTRRGGQKPDICSSCNRNVGVPLPDDDDPEFSCQMVQCTTCLKWQCYRCLPYTREQANVLGDNAISWKCAACKDKVPEQIDVLKRLETKMDQILATLGEKASKADMDNLEKRVSDNTKELAELKAKQQEGASGGTDISKCLNEMAERESRKNNVVMFKVPESMADDIEARIMHHLELAKSLLAKLQLNIEISKEQVRRLGKKTNDKDKPRPMRVTFKEEDDKRKILKAASQIKDKAKDCPRLKEIIVKPDLTPHQRTEDEKLRKEWISKKEESAKKGDTTAKWIRRRGKVVNVGPKPPDPVQRQDPPAGTSGQQTETPGTPTRQVDPAILELGSPV